MQISADRIYREHADRVCLTLVQSELDLAFFNLRLAEAEIQGGKAAHATELVAKALIAYKIVLLELARITDVYERKRELAAEARRLLESIQSVERNFRIL
jgi:hypothetical protein